jgi:2-polyprenyl-6-methoxyphenol hydroxylase-like FAD-dependent oxidoreductase
MSTSGAGNIIIVGGGPTGLSIAISLVVFCGVPAENIQVFEKRTETPSRSNYLIVNWLGQSRLSALGVYPLLAREKTVADYRKVTLQDDLVNSKDTFPLKSKLPSSKVLSTNTQVKDMLKAQNSGEGIVGIQLADLELALRERAAELGIGCTIAECQLVWNSTAYSVSLPETGRTLEAGLVVLAEGSQRVVAKRDLGLSAVPVNPATLMNRVNLTPVRSQFLSVWKRPQKQGGPQLNQLLYGDPSDHNRLGLSFVGVPQELQHEDAARSRYVTNAVHEHLVLAGLDASVQITSVEPVPFVVEDAIMSRLAKHNVLIVGDAARTGHFFTGIGAQFGLLHDADLVCQFVHEWKQGSAELSKLTGEFEARMRKGSIDFFEFNSAKWYKSFEAAKL